jgi:hypothetical protein
MRFTWRGLVLAPLLAPAVCCAILSCLAGGANGNPLLAFLILMIPGCIVSYGATVFLLLPSLFVLSRLLRATALRVCLLGFGLGGGLLLPVALLAWKSSGTDSGPPDEPLPTFLMHWLADPTTAAFPLAGLVTAAAYWWLGKPTAPASPAPHSGPSLRAAGG